MRAKRRGSVCEGVRQCEMSGKEVVIFVVLSNGRPPTKPDACAPKSDAKFGSAPRASAGARCLRFDRPGSLTEGTKRATSVSVQLLHLRKDLRTGSISRDIANFPSELCGRRRAIFVEVACLVPPGPYITAPST